MTAMGGVDVDGHERRGTRTLLTIRCDRGDANDLSIHLKRHAFVATGDAVAAEQDADGWGERKRTDEFDELAAGKNFCVHFITSILGIIRNAPKNGDPGRTRVLALAGLVGVSVLVDPRTPYAARFDRRLPHRGVVLPELDRAGVHLAVERHTRSALRLPERIPHHGDGRHRALGRLELRVDRDDAPLGVGDVSLGDRLLLVLLHELLVRVEDEVEPLGAGRLETLEPAGQDRELAITPRLVAGAQEADVVGGDAGDAGLGGAGVRDEQVLAERRVAVHQHRARFERLVGHLDQLFAGHPGDAGSGEGGCPVTTESEPSDVDVAH